MPVFDFRNGFMLLVVSKIKVLLRRMLPGWELEI